MQGTKDVAGFFSTKDMAGFSIVGFFLFLGDSAKFIPFTK